MNGAAAEHKQGERGNREEAHTRRDGRCCSPIRTQARTIPKEVGREGSLSPNHPTISDGMHPCVAALTIVLSTVSASGCTFGNGDHSTAPPAAVSAASIPQTSAPVFTGPATIVTVSKSVPTSTTTTRPPAGRDAVMAAYTRYVASRSSSAVTDGASGAAAYRLAHREAAPEIVTVHGIRYGASSAAVEECANGTERLVVLTFDVGGWAVSHVIGADPLAEWCE